MILVVDLGNSRLKWAWAEGEALAGHGRCAYEADHLGEVLDREWGSAAAPGRVVVANVGGKEAAQALDEWLSGSWNLKPELLTGSAQACGVRSAYTDPGCLGADRWAALIAARALYRRPACVVDCGTAVTVDALSGEGEHLGGLIFPGLSMMRRCLVTNTRGIGEMGEGMHGEASLLTRNTRDGVTAGTLYALVAALDRIAEDVTGELGTRAVRIVTGGDAATLLPLLAGSWEDCPDLVLAGLAVYANAP